MKTRRKNILCYGSQFCAGGIAYGGMEIAWRGYTHFSMLLLGGICFCILIRLSKTGLPFGGKCLAGGLIITVAELAAGCIVNLWLCLDVWDYSHEFGDLWGQICVRYTLLWCTLSAGVISGCQCLRIYTGRLMALPLWRRPVLSANRRRYSSQQAR